jgi:hypothetical protein
MTTTFLRAAKKFLREHEIFGNRCADNGVAAERVVDVAADEDALTICDLVDYAWRIIYRLSTAIAHR